MRRLNGSAAVVQAAVATALTDVIYARELAMNGDQELAKVVGRRVADELQELANSRLKLFEASLLRVRHNFLWSVCPRTLEFLKASGRELSAFAEYGSLKQYKAGISTSERLASFASFLSSYFDRNQLKDAQVVFCSELTKHDVRQADRR